VTDRLAATVNRTGIHSLEVPDAFETDGPFTVELRNQGQATHVHLHLDDSLSTVATLEAGNHYVEADSVRSVRVHVDGVEESTRGKLKVVTAYGAETHWVDVSLDPPHKEPVEVDPELSKPQPEERADGLLDAGLVTALPAAALGLVAVVLAVGAVLSPGGTDTLLAGLAVLAGFLGAGYLLLR
jgi:hypothetical protein